MTMPRIWLSERDSCKLVKRSRYTLRDWALQGLVLRRKYRQSWEYERQSLLYGHNAVAWKMRHRLVTHWNRDEALQILTECLHQQIPFPSDPGLATWLQVSHPQARAWKRQWIVRANENTWHRSDDEIADRINTTPKNVAEARRALDGRRRAARIYNERKIL